jgi:hypothetical protein
LAELGRGNELSLAEARSGLKSWSLAASLAELGRGEEWSLSEVPEGRSGREPWSLGWCKPYGCFIFVLFLWLAVLSASGCVVKMVRRRETGRATVTAGGGSVEESGEGGGRDTTGLRIESYIAFTYANIAWCCDALASRRRWHMRNNSGSCLGYSFFCLERLVSCTVCDGIISVIKLFDVTNLYRRWMGSIMINYLIEPSMRQR